MKLRTCALIGAALVAMIALLACSVVPGHAGGGVFVGVGVGVPFWYPYPYVYPYPYPVYAPPVVVQQQQPVYVQADSPAPFQPQYWYYCQGSQSYYPYVSECPGGWTPVPPQVEQLPQEPGPPPR